MKILMFIFCLFLIGCENPKKTVENKTKDITFNVIWAQGYNYTKLEYNDLWIIGEWETDNLQNNFINIYNKYDFYVFITTTSKEYTTLIHKDNNKILINVYGEKVLSCSGEIRDKL
jgi:hypothetical protein